MAERLHLYAAGRVQGVWYRASTAQEARRLGLVGWVRNLPDGRVEAVAEGNRATLDALVRFCRKGPPLARVTGLEVSWGMGFGLFDSFEVR
jgi:acylphosphatase